jgi:hypothetical protein
MNGVIEVETGDDPSKSGSNPIAPPSTTAPTSPAAPAGNRSPTSPASSGSNFDALPEAPGATGSGGKTEGPATRSRQRVVKQAVNAEGRRFVSIVGLFPLQEQIKKYMTALGEKRPMATELIDLKDFELQRKKAVAGDDPWNVEWERVDPEVAFEVLSRTEFAIDVVDVMMTDGVITMPLPERFGGNWDFWASHPGIKKLTKQQQELQTLAIQKLIDAQQDQQAEDAKDAKRGFASMQHAVRDYARKLQASTV